MQRISLIIVADRGSLKAYEVNHTPNRGRNLKLVQAFDTTDAHGRFEDKVTDQAGRFAVGAGAAGSHQSSSNSERTGIDAENDKRIFKQLADAISEIVQRAGNGDWSFAAPASIHAGVVELLAPEARDRIVEQVKADLVKIELSKLSEHFRSLQPM